MEAIDKDILKDAIKTEKELKLLISCLRKYAEEEREEKEKAECNYLRGHSAGEAIAYDLCAKWIEEIINREKPKYEID